MANQATASCSRFTAVFSIVFFYFLALVWLAEALEEECLNGGTTHPSGGCSCIEGFDGPRCTLMSLGFDGTGFAVYPPIPQSNSTRIRLEVAPEQDTGLVLYVGPYEFDGRYPLQNFVALELHRGVVVLVVDYGLANAFVLDSRNCSVGVPQPGKPFIVELVFTKTEIEMVIGNMCRLVSSVERLSRVRFDNPGFLNREDPLLLGGTAEDGQHLAFLYDWTYEPLSKGFSGCLRNVTVNGRLINLDMPNEWKGVRPGCRRPKPAAKHSYVSWALAFSLAIIFVMLAIKVYDALLPCPAPHEQDNAVEMQHPIEPVAPVEL